MRAKTSKRTINRIANTTGIPRAVVKDAASSAYVIWALRGGKPSQEGREVVRMVFGFELSTEGIREAINRHVEWYIRHAVKIVLPGTVEYITTTVKVGGK
jgi:hypothetical protein